MFSRISASSYSRVISKSRVISQSCPQNRSLHISRIKDINSRISSLGYSSNHSTIFNTNFVRFASTTETTKVTAQDSPSPTPTQDTLPQIPDAPVPIEPEIAEIVGEASLASFDLGGWLPIGLTQECLYWLHTTCGLPWWSTIIVGTAIVKIGTFPIFLRMQRHQALQQYYKKDLDYFERQKKEALENGDQLKIQVYSGKQEAFYASHNMMTMTKTMLHYAVQGSVFFSLFMALNGMARAPITSMTEGGIGWFTDLTVTDPYYILPLLASGSTALFIYLSPPPAIGVRMDGLAKYLPFIAPVISFPVMIFLKSTVLLYIMTSTWLTFLSQALLRIPWFRAICKVPPIVESQVIVNQISKPTSNTVELMTTVKDTWKGIKHSRAANAAYGLDQRSFDIAGRGPIIKTYKYDPTKVKAASRKVDG